MTLYIHAQLVNNFDLYCQCTFCTWSYSGPHTKWFSSSFSYRVIMVYVAEFQTNTHLDFIPFTKVLQRLWGQWRQSLTVVVLSQQQGITSPEGLQQRCPVEVEKISQLEPQGDIYKAEAIWSIVGILASPILFCCKFFFHCEWFKPFCLATWKERRPIVWWSVDCSAYITFYIRWNDFLVLLYIMFKHRCEHLTDVWNCHLHSLLLPLGILLSHYSATRLFCYSVTAHCSSNAP